MFFLRLIFILLISNIIYAKPILVDENTKFTDVLSSSDIFIDKSMNLSFEQIKNKDFQKNEKALLAFGYDPKINVWIKFTIKNTSNKNVRKVLEYSNSLTTNIQFYSPDNSYKKPIQEGLFNIQDNRRTIKPFFDIHLNPNETKTFYIKASSSITTLIIKASIYDKDTFYQNELYHQAVLSLFFGSMFILGFYNIFIYFFTKDISYFYYVLYIFSISLHHIFYTGMSNIYFSQIIIIEAIKNSSIIVALPIYSLALFTKSFLQIPKYRKLNYVLNVFLVLIPISLIFYYFTDGYDKYRNVLTLILMLYLIFITIYSSIKKNRQAYFILLGWVLIFIAILFMVLSSLGIFDIFQYFSYYVEASLLTEVVVFSIALADRINSLQNEKNEINEKLIKQQQTETQRLSQKVSERTEELEKALDEKSLLLKELHHRVKNNMQTIVSLIRLQNDEIKNEKLHNILLTIQNRINAMSHLHELLYNQNNLSHIDAFEYFDVLIEEIRDSYEENIKINLDIQTNLKIEQAIYTGLILNELLTNSFKHAFPEKSGHIYISLKKVNNFITLLVKDDGIGYKKQKTTSTLGLILIETLTLNQLNGSIDIDSKKGVSTKIVWEEDE